MNPNYNNNNNFERGTLRSNHNPNLPPTYGSHPSSGPAPSTAGHHTHDILNKLDPRVDSTHDNQPLPTQTQPVHNSKLANMLDPRVDSRAANAQQQQGIHGGVGAHSSSGMMMGSSSSGVREGTYGPHSTRMQNAMDPTVDSDLDSHGMRRHNAVPGTAGYTSNMTGVPSGGVRHGAGPEVMHGAGGPNAAVMSNAHNNHGHGHGTTTAGYDNHHSGGMMGGNNHSGGMGMGMGGQHMMEQQQRGHLPGPAPNTAGPHKSDLLNKLDPRVDSKGGSSLGGHNAAGGTYRGDDVRRGI